jgi:hypothetical protein
MIPSKTRIATSLPTGLRKTLHPSDNRHCASSAKNSDENQVAAPQCKAKTNSREQGKSDQLPAWRHMHTVCELNAGK